jgi:hypothetical protein
LNAEGAKVSQRAQKEDKEYKRGKERRKKKPLNKTEKQISNLCS